jgi:superfamily II DNA helicase RecQ
MYQLPALCLSGVSLVVSPLIALMQDQVVALKEKVGASSRASQYLVEFYDSKSSAETKQKIKSILYNAERDITGQGKSAVIYVTPEFLKMDFNRKLVEGLGKNLCLVAFDEAHCVLEFGNDFRPNYLSMGWISQLPGVRTIALTASVSEVSLGSILDNLQMDHAKIIRSPFDRKNICYFVNYSDNLAFMGGSEVERKVDDMIEWIERYAPGETSGIVYIRSKKDCDEVCQRLNERGLKAAAYYSGVKEKNQVGGVFIILTFFSFCFVCFVFFVFCFQGARALDER